MLLLRKVKALFTSKKDNNLHANDGNGWVMVEEIVPQPSEVSLPEQAEMDIGWVPPEKPDYEGYEAPRAQAQGSSVEGISCELHVYTDGSLCENKSGYGIYAPNDDQMNRAVRLDSPHSIDRAEIQAIIQALLYIESNRISRPDFYENYYKTVIFTDSQTTILALHHIRCERESWRHPKMPSHLRHILPSIIENYRKELNILLSLAERFDGVVTISHVRSHIGIDGNEWADLFAKMSTMTVQRALRSKGNDLARKSDQIWPSRTFVPFITIRPSASKKNRSLMLLDIEDQENSVLYPRQQVVWDRHHSMTFEELFEEMTEFIGNTYEERNQPQFQYYR